jgi:hypothetical protein
LEDERVTRLKTSEDCESFAKNIETNYPQLALGARRRAVELKAAAYGATTAVEREALEAIYAAEAALTLRNGKKTRASRTWQSIQRHGILQTVERVVSKKRPTDGYAVLMEMGMPDFTFEAVIMRNQSAFSPDTVAHAKARIAEQDIA